MSNVKQIPGKKLLEERRKFPMISSKNGSDQVKLASLYHEIYFFRSFVVIVLVIVMLHINR